MVKENKQRETTMLQLRVCLDRYDLFCWNWKIFVESIVNKDKNYLK